jgi:hypothetical protein
MSICNASSHDLLNRPGPTAYARPTSAVGCRVADYLLPKVLLLGIHILLRSTRPLSLFMLTRNHLDGLVSVCKDRKAMLFNDWRSTRGYLLPNASCGAVGCHLAEVVTLPFRVVFPACWTCSGLSPDIIVIRIQRLRCW